MVRQKNRIQKRRKPKVADFISYDKNIVNNFIYYKDMTITIIHTKFDPKDELENDDSLTYRKRYVPWKDKDQLQNVVKLSPEELHPKNEQVKTETEIKIEGNQGRERAAKKREIDYNADGPEPKVEYNDEANKSLRPTPRKREQSTSVKKKTKKEAVSEQEWEVEEIIGKRRFGNVVRYHVVWKGWPLESATWERKANLTNCQETLADFEKKLSLNDTVTD